MLWRLAGAVLLCTGTVLLAHSFLVKMRSERDAEERRRHAQALRQSMEVSSSTEANQQMSRPAEEESERQGGGGGGGDSQDLCIVCCEDARDVVLLPWSTPSLPIMKNNDRMQMSLISCLTLPSIDIF